LAHSGDSALDPKIKFSPPVTSKCLCRAEGDFNRRASPCGYRRHLFLNKMLSAAPTGEGALPFRLAKGQLLSEIIPIRGCGRTACIDGRGGIEKVAAAARA
jgi:hypothetical protein